MKSGSVVEYIDKEKITCAVIQEVKQRRMRLLTQNNREVKMSAARLSDYGGVCLDLSMGRDRLVETLRDISRKRDELAARIDIQELWEVLNSEQEWIDLGTMTAFCFPDSSNGDHASAVMRAFFRNRRYFKFSPEGFFPYTEEEVERKIAQEKEAARRKRIVEGASRWVRELLSGTSATTPAGLSGEQADFVDILKSYFLFDTQSPHRDLARAILKKAGVKSVESLFDFFVKLGTFSQDENLDLYRLEIPVAFPPAATQEAGALTSQALDPRDLEKRRDLTALAVITIDGQGTQDFDDALSIEDLGDRYRIGVHIMDVAHYVRPGSALDREALHRASSIYMPDRKIPMLPPELAESHCSLMAGQRRPAISILAVVGKPPSAGIMDFEIVPSVIEVKRQLTYSEANELLDAEAGMAALADVARAFQRRRLDEGAVQINLPEINIWLDDDGRVNVSRGNRESPARLLVSELMIMANWLMARSLSEQGIAAVFRSQPEPRERLYRGTEGTLFQNWMQRRLVSRFVLSHEAESHSGLGLDAYVTATSPIRKYFDLLTQRQIRALLGLEAASSAEEIDRLIQLLEEPMANVGRIQFRRNRYWLLKYLEGLVGQRLEGVVLYKKRHGYQVLLVDYMIEATLPLSGGFELKPEDLVQVTLQQVNARRDTLSVFMS
jgi:exoribonuclease-2